MSGQAITKMTKQPLFNGCNLESGEYMKIIDFSSQYIEQAQKLALDNYNEEREFVKSLPAVENVPDVSHFSENGLGVCALENDKLVGFLGCFLPWDNSFDTLAKGTFTPCFAHGAVKENRDKIYQRMYQYAADKWVKNKILYHAVSFYAHDEVALSAMFTYGFGIRCMDAMREMKTFETKAAPSDITFGELSKENIATIKDMCCSLRNHLGESPCFMYSSEDCFNEWFERVKTRNSVFFAAKDNDVPIAYLEVTDSGETFASEQEEVRNICGAYCKPEYRGKNIMQGILNYAITKYEKEGYKSFGVDFESFNPTAHAFWLKHFDGYTKSVTRRIDEGILNKY